MKIQLNRVRLSFPHLFEPQAAKQGDGEPKYNASFLLDKATQADQIAAIRATMVAVAKEKWPLGIPKTVCGEKVCLRDGSTKEYDGYGENIEFLTASSGVRPTVIDRNRAPLTAADGKPFAGCYVNAIVDIWAQDNQFGKRINAQLKGVQFVEDGEPFGDKATAPDEFADLDAAKSPLPTTPFPGDVAPDDIPF